MFSIDAHLDLSMNAMEWNRDLRLPISAIRQREMGFNDKPDRGKGMVSFPALREGNIGLVVATQIARYVALDNHLPGWHSPEQAWAQTQGQRAWYQAMEDSGEMLAITDLSALEAHCEYWCKSETESKKIGYILSLEGADSLISPKYLETAWQYGLRAVGPAHYGPGRYAQGTDATGRLTHAGVELLKEMDNLGIILDATHLCDESFWHAMDIFHGPVWASHNNCRSLVNHNRQFSDEQLKVLVQRGAVIGGALDAWMMVPGWVRGKSTPKQMKCDLETIIDHFDHICQIAGNANHIGIGSDLDGAFGSEQSPYDLESIASLNRLPQLLSKRGYNESDIQKVMSGNWLRFLRQAWSE